jgi:hypothetical protein
MSAFNPDMKIAIIFIENFWLNQFIQIKFQQAEDKSAFKILTEKLTGKRSLERPRRKWENNVRINFKEIFVYTRNWVDLAQDSDYWKAALNPGFHKP